MNPSRVKCIQRLLLLPAILSSSCETFVKNQTRAEQAREADAHSIGVQAYIYGLAPVEAYRTRHEWTQDPTSPLHAPVNRFRHERELLTPETQDAIEADDSTLHSHAWIDLAKGPVVLRMPPLKGRWYVFQLMDFWTNVFAYAGPGWMKSRVGDCVLVPPDWKDELPADLIKIQAPTPVVWLSALTAVDGPEDLEAAHRFQDQYSLTPLALWSRKGEGPAEPDPSADPPAAYEPVPLAEKPPAPVKDDFRFFEVLNSFLHETPIPRRDAALMKAFGRIGIGPEGGFSVEALDASTAAGLRRAMKEGELIVEEKTRDLSMSVGGWVMTTPGIGAYGDDYLLRAACARAALGAPDDRLYVAALAAVDSGGEPLDGRSRYELHFEKDRLPPVVFFWTIPIYTSPEGRFAANPIGRYSIGSRTRGLRYGEDGSLTIHIQHESPGGEKESNWLPAPAGAFRLAPRFYGPKAPLRDRTYELPPIQRLDG